MANKEEQEQEQQTQYCDVIGDNGLTKNLLRERGEEE